MTKIGVFVGSLRKDSWNRKVANELVSLLPEGYEAEFFEIGNLPLYNEDWDQSGSVPEVVQDFRKAVAGVDAFIWTTPEYNRGVPGVLKNAIDVASKPMQDAVFAGKPYLIASASTGSMGGFGSNHHLRQTLVFVNSPVVAQPEIYLSFIDKAYDESGKMKAGTRDFLAKGIEAFTKLIGHYQV